jgi:spermidine synthase
MKPWVTLAEATAPDGEKLVLQRRDTETVIRVGGQVLMTSRAHDSERALAIVAAEHLKEVAEPRVLIGGLGLGFTLRGMLEELPAAKVIVAELSPAIVEWNRTVLNNEAMNDSRVTVYEGDVATLIRRERGLDAIVLDVDNGPSPLTTKRNRTLYGEKALGDARRALKESGIYIVWSAGDDHAFGQRMKEAGFAVERRTIVSHGSKHVLFIGRPGTPGRRL